MIRYPDSLHIGLVNNMPDAALEATERQFTGLLRASAGDLPVRLSLYALPEVPRQADARRRIAAQYSPIAELWETSLDGLIVTGAEPLTARLEQEPYWPSLARLIDWAELRTHSTIWSCLAAHAAALRLDGIRRRRMREKLCGVFEAAHASPHTLTAALPAHPRLPHSRWNGLPEAELNRCGYRILTHSTHAGVDTFIKQRDSLFVFFQGHPEYEAETLLLEYRRDVRRFLRRQTDAWPATPHAYFTEENAALLDDMKRTALAHRTEESMAAFPYAALAANLRNTWRPEATALYRNWLHYLAVEKNLRIETGRPLALAESA